MIRLLSALAALALAAPTFAQSLDPLLATENLWALKQDEFLAAAGKVKFQWTSVTRDSARVAEKDLTAFGLPAVESVARFDGGKLNEIIVVLYARGDSGDLPKDKFDALVRTSADALTKATSVKFTARGKDPTNAVKADGLLWQTDKARYLLEYSFTKEVKPRIPYRAEFVRLEITAPEKKLSLLASATNTTRAKFSGPMHVKRDTTSGDVFIPDVPMVDQGQKGYCVVAATERVMRYYGTQVDENELAQVANTSTEGGTSSDAMIDALKKLSARLKVRVREIEKFDIKELLKLITDYNLAAKRAKSPPIPDQGDIINVAAVYRAMNVDLLREVRTKNKSDLHRFQRSVQAHIDQGTPLLWTVNLGKVPEPDIPQDAGGHMRLIIGYNTPKDEILYSDTWGAGHELKRMSATDAWTITNGTMSIEPL